MIAQKVVVKDGLKLAIIGQVRKVEKWEIGQVRKLKVEKADRVHNLEDVAMGQGLNSEAEKMGHLIDLNLEPNSCDVAMMKVLQCGEIMKDQGVLGNKCIVAIVVKVDNLVLEIVYVVAVADVATR